jgi:RNA polymerase sigma-70 factor, ECF subfamily
MTDRHAQLAELMARVALRDRSAFRALFDSTQGVVFAVCFRVLHDREVAEEVVQDTYLKIWNRAGDYRADRGAALTWILAIARNRCLDVVRRRGVDDAPWEDHYTETLADDTLTPAEHVEAHTEALAVRRCLRTLDDAHRSAVEIAFVEGLAHPEVAVRLNRPLGTVKSQIRRGLLKLRTCLEAGGAIPS